MYITMRIADIQVGNRARKDMGDLQPLMDSIEKTGLLQPIGVNQENVLIFGGRRLEAFKLLGRKEIPVWTLDVPSIMQAEYDENEIRKQFDVSERVALADALMEEERAAAKERMLAGKAADTLGSNDPRVDKGKARKFAAQRAGLGSEGTYQRAKVAVAHGIPEVVDAMDRGDISPNMASTVAKFPKDRQPDELKRALSKQPISPVPKKKEVTDNPRKRGDPNVFIDPDYAESITQLSTKVIGMLGKMRPTMRRDPVAVERLRMISDECTSMINEIQARRAQ